MKEDFDWLKPDPVLLVQDEALLQGDLMDVLKEAAFAPQGASSTARALELFEQTPFDTVVADVRLSDQTDGLGLLQALKSKHPGLRSVVTSGYPDEEITHRAIALTADDFIYKPYKSEAMISALHRLKRAAEHRKAYKRLLLGDRPPTPAPSSAEEEALQQLLADLDAHRDQALQAYFLAMRTELISKDQALEVWDVLEPQERFYEKVREGNSVADSNQATTLIRDYTQMFDLMKVITWAQPDSKLPKHRTSWQVDKVRFDGFYNKAQNGALGPELLRVAAAVRRTPPRARSLNPQLEHLYNTIWE